MRRLFLTLLFLGTVAGLGCKTPQFYNPSRQQVNDQPPPAYMPTAEEVVKHINENAKLVSSLECNDDLSIQIRQGVQEFSVGGMLQFQKPRNFRLTAEKLNTTQADIGSNDREFWFWLKQNNPPSMFFCKYEDFARMTSNPLPVHPDWIAEAMCLQELNPTAQYQVRRSGQYSLDLITTAPSPQGVPMQKIITVAHGGKYDGRIIGQKIRTADGKDIWTAEVLEYQDIPGYAIPKVVVLRCPAEKLEMKFRMNRCQLNRLNAGNNPRLFERPHIQGAEVVDIYQYHRPPNNNHPTNNIRRVRGQK
jgi:hypothetical protein